MNYFTLLLLTMISICVNTQAQQTTSQIKGSITGHDNTPVAFATVILLTQDTVFVKGEVTKADGSFLIVGIKPNSYRIKIQNLEYETYITNNFNLEPNETMTLPVIKLEKSVTQLNEVIVHEKKAMIEVHPDKMVFNVASSINASGNNGLELLGKAPGVIIDPDKNIILQGKSGVRIFINGRPSRLSGPDLVNMLQSMQSDNIESIEIMTNPSSKYEAAGNAGIINIKLKKNIDLGYNGTVVSNVSKGDYARYNNGLSLNYRGSKINIAGNLNQFNSDNQNDFNDTKEQSGFLLEQKSIGLNHNEGYNFSAGMDYTINDKHSLSLEGRGVMSKGSGISKGTTNIISNTGKDPNEILLAASEANFNSKNMNYNMNYTYTPSKTSNVSVDVSLGNFSNDQKTYQPNTYFQTDLSNLIKEVNNTFNANNTINLWSAQVDYEKKIKKMTLSTGGKYSYINTDNEFAFYKIENSQQVLDVNKSNNFTYLEKVSSAYLIFSSSLSEKVNLNAGLRIENTSSSARLISQLAIKDSDVTRNYTNLFPNISLSYSNKKNSELSMSIGRRISRPNYQDLNPFETKLSELVSFKGNPFLKPNYTMNYEITYSYKSKLVVSNTYSVTTNDFVSILEIVDSKGTFLVPQNMQRTTNNGLSLSYPATVSKWWELASFINYNYSTYSGQFESTVINLSASVFNFRIQNNFSLPAGIRLDLSYFYLSPFVWRGSLKIDELSGIDIGLKKDFFDGLLQLRITAQDILNKNSDYHYHGNYGGLNIDGVLSVDNRRYGAGLTFKFGNQKLKAARNKKGALDDELNRISKD